MWSPDLLLTFLIVLTFTFFILTLYAILQAHLDFFNIEKTNLFSVKILDTASSSSLFITLLGALVVRHQFVLGFRPRISYKSMQTLKQNPSNDKQHYEVWQVRISNTGLGAAIISRTNFDLEIFSTKGIPSLMSLNEVVNEVERSGLIRDRDYWIENISSGFTLPPKEDCILFEIKIEHLRKIKRLDMILHFQGLLGDKYFRDIFFLPRGSK